LELGSVLPVENVPLEPVLGNDPTGDEPGGGNDGAVASNSPEVSLRTESIADSVCREEDMPRFTSEDALVC